MEKRYIVTLTNEAASLTAGEVKTLLTEDLDWEVFDVSVEAFNEDPDVFPQRGEATCDFDNNLAVECHDGEMFFCADHYAEFLRLVEDNPSFEGAYELIKEEAMAAAYRKAVREWHLDSFNGGSIPSLKWLAMEDARAVLLDSGWTPEQLAPIFDQEVAAANDERAKS